MPNPIANIPASIKLRALAAPPQVFTTDYEGELTKALRISGVTSLPPVGAGASGSVSKTVTVAAGSPYLFLAPGNTPADVPAGSTVSTTEFSGVAVVEMTQADTVKAGCTFTNSGELVKVPTGASNDGLVIGAKVTHTGPGSNVIAAGATIQIVNNLRYTVQVTVSGSSVTLVTGVITVVSGQFVSINGTNYTVNIGGTSVSSFSLTAGPATPPNGSYVAIVGALLTLSTNGVTGDQTGQNLTVGGYIRMTDNAIGSLTSGTYAFQTYSSVRGLGDVRDGDYFEMAVGVGVDLLDLPTSYVFLHGYVRRPDVTTKTFLVWDAEKGGKAIQEVGSGIPWFVGAVKSEAPYINIYQKPYLRFSFKEVARLAGRLAKAPGLEAGEGPPVPRIARLKGRLVKVPEFNTLSPSKYVRPVLAGIRGRMAVLPRFVFAQDQVRCAEGWLTGRLSTGPRLRGGHVRPPRQLCRAVVQGGVVRPLSSGEAFTVRGRLVSRVPMALLTGHEYLRRTVPVRALVGGTARFVVAGRGLSVRDAIADCLGVWNLRYNARGVTAEDVKERSVADLNAALQLIYSRARRLDYFNRSTLMVQVNPGQRCAVLPNTVQTVLGTARLKATEHAAESRPLFATKSLAEAMQFTTLYGGPGAGGTPLAYYIDRRAQAEANAVRSALMLAPPPASTVYVDLEVALEAPRYTWRDVELATPLQLPSTYAESLLIPIVRQRAATYRLFSNETLRPAIEAHYQKAMLTLGLVDAAPNQQAELQTLEVGGLE